MTLSPLGCGEEAKKKNTVRVEQSEQLLRTALGLTRDHLLLARVPKSCMALALLLT